MLHFANLFYLFSFLFPVEKEARLNCELDQQQHDIESFMLWSQCYAGCLKTY